VKHGGRDRGRLGGIAGDLEADLRLCAELHSQLLPRLRIRFESTAVVMEAQ
jgi:hypothetical protein